MIFDINKYSKFKDKIIYNVIDDQPSNIESISENDDKETKGRKLINNSNKREHYQREMALKSLDEADPNDIILINDVDEIPNLKNVDFMKVNKKLIIFKQKVFCYKFNLLYEGICWHGSRACKKKDFISPQWLRDTKHKKYPMWRLDTLFSKIKYSSIHYVENGGWHFTNIKTPEDIEKKYLNFLHHQDFEYSKLKLEDIRRIVKNKKILYDYNADQRNYKWGSSKSLTKIPLYEMPEYINKNKEKYDEWLEN